MGKWEENKTLFGETEKKDAKKTRKGKILVSRDKKYDRKEKLLLRATQKTNKNPKLLWLFGIVFRNGDVKVICACKFEKKNFLNVGRYHTILLL